MQFQKQLHFRKKQMRDRAFAERCAARRASATAKAMEIITDAGVIEMAREHMEKYENCTEAFNTTVNGALVDSVTGTVCEDLHKYKDHTEAFDTTAIDSVMEEAEITEKHKKELIASAEAIDTTVNDPVTELATDMAQEELETYENCTEALDTTIHDSDACMPDASAPESILKESGEDEQMPDYVQVVNDTSIYKNCKSLVVKGVARKDDVFIPLSMPKHYNGYDMIPVFGGGAVRQTCVQPYPAAIVISSNC